MTKLQSFIRKHGRPFTKTYKNGKGVLKIQFHDGYVSLVGIQPGTRRYRQEIRITKSAWFAILRSVSDPTLRMRGPDFDAHAAERAYLQQEQQHLAALRQEKRDRRRVPAVDAQKKRYAAAKRRARSRRERTSDDATS